MRSLMIFTAFTVLAAAPVTVYATDPEIEDYYGDSDDQLYVIVCNDDLYPVLEYNGDLDDYIDQVVSEGYYVALVTCDEDGELQHEVLRDFLIENFYTPPEFFYLMFVGTVPYAFFYDEVAPPSIFLFDIFYSELDGDWIDEDSDKVYDYSTVGYDIQPDIAVGRLHAESLDGPTLPEYVLIRDYLAKNISYRTGELTLPPAKALNYVDDSCVPFSDDIRETLETSFGEDNVDTIDDPYETYDEDFEDRIDPLISEGYEWVEISTPGESTAYDFVIPNDPRTYRTHYYEITSIGPDVLFYVHHGCMSHRFTERNYIGGWQVFTPNGNGLASLGQTSEVGGGGFVWDWFHDALSDGKTIGEAFMEETSKANCEGYMGNLYYYYMCAVLIGDPTLKISEHMFGRGSFGDGCNSEKLSNNVRITLASPNPNPVRGPATFEYELEGSYDGPGYLDIYDITGRKVDTVEFAHNGPRNTIDWDATAAASGVYIAQTRLGKCVAVRKFVVVK